MAALPAGLRIVQDSPTVGRAKRKPTHSFNLQVKPWHIQPFMTAPVLPGETLESLLLQARSVTDPLLSPITGWWSEWFVFYVKHRDLSIRDTVTAMHLDASGVPIAVADAPDALTYHNRAGINWTRRCLDRIVETYFRDDGEPATGDLNGLPVASLQMQGWWDSVKDATVTPTGHQPNDLPGDDDVPNSVIPGYETAFAQWQNMIAMKVTDATFEDYLRSFGIKPPVDVREELHKPELLRYVRDWTYPSNTVNPADGTTSTACSWAIQERADKARFFQEPGFIVGVCVHRPKVYSNMMLGGAVDLLDNAYAWLPAVLDAEPYTSLKLVAKTDGPLAGGTTNDYWVDLRDLFIYGDQFLNVTGSTAMQTGRIPNTGRPNTDLTNKNTKYPSSLDQGRQFKSSAAGTNIRMDGVCNLTILSRLRDLT